jgi:threonine/homoserine/homoserine lactone efflux protein
MSPTELAALLAYATAMAFTPGPNTTLSAALAANHGLRHAMRFVVAVPVGWCLLLVASMAGLGALVAALPALGEAVRWVGVAYMLWLALRLWSRQATPVNADDRLAGFDVGFARGVALQFVNGKAWLNALTISATWITVEGQTALRAAQVLPIAAFYGLASNFTYACVGAALRAWLAQGQRLRNFNRTMALVLVATALWILRA